MTIPGKRDFHNWNIWSRKNLSTRSLSKMLEILSDEESLPDDLEQHAKNYIGVLGNIANNERWRHRNDYSVHQWLECQPGFKRASFLAFGDRRHGAPLLKWEDVCASHISAICNSKIPGSARQKVNDAADTMRPHYWWESYLIRAIDEYIHINHDEVFSATSKMEKNCKSILRLIEEIRPAIDADSWTSANNLKSAIKQIDFWNRTLQPHGLLKNRNNKFKAEHRFIERMYSANMRFFKTAKPQVIAELMTLECFDKQFDLRHINRLCSTIKMTRLGVKSKIPVMASEAN